MSASAGAAVAIVARRAIVVALALSLAACAEHGQPVASSDFVGGATCARCHVAEAERWRGSDHDLAMDRATPESVRGDFRAGAAAKGWHVSTEGGRFFVEAVGPSGTAQRLPVEYTIGVRPLQQYVVALERGWLQTTTLSWDVERGAWFDLQAGASHPPGSWLHWTGGGYNWNAMCADCHATDFEKRYDRERRAYTSRYREIDVSCEACHGPGSVHVARAERGSWQDGSGLAPLKSRTADVELESCGRCHALRHEIYPGYRPGRSFFDHYVPELLDSDTYHPDGQILGESYEYGSFVQSRMYREHVHCSDCHDPHTTRLVAEGNALCTRCHEAAQLDVPAHHHHPPGSTGARCVECHMPERTYMEIDERRDHGFKIPRPDLTLRLGTPNACTSCHAERSPEWALATVREWYGDRREHAPHFADAIAGGRRGDREAEAPLAALVRDRDAGALVRASALALLRQYTGEGSRGAARDALDDPDPLVRATAVGSLEWFPVEERRARALPLLRDEIRLVRTEAAQVLAGDAGIPDAERAHLTATLDEYVHGQLALTDDRMANHNLGRLYTQLGEVARAEQFYREAIRLQDDFVAARYNLALLLERQGRSDDAGRELRALVRSAPEFADGHFSLGLLLAGRGEVAAALPLLERAVALAPTRSRHHYNVAVALRELGRRGEAEAAFEAARERDPASTDTLLALTMLAVDRQDWPVARARARALRALDPRNARFAQLLASIEGRAVNPRIADDPE